MEQQLIDIIGDSEKVKRVLAAIAAKNPMRKYLGTALGKAAKRRANTKYIEKSHEMSKQQIDVKKHLQEWRHNAREAGGYESPDDEQEHPILVRYPSISELWHDYIQNHTECTRKVYAEVLLASIRDADSVVKNGKIDYLAAFQLEI